MDKLTLEQRARQALQTAIARESRNLMRLKLKQRDFVPWSPPPKESLSTNEDGFVVLPMGDPFEENGHGIGSRYEMVKIFAEVAATEYGVPVLVVADSTSYGGERPIQASAQPNQKAQSVNAGYMGMVFDAESEF